MKKSVKTNYIYNLVYQIMVILLPIITTPYLSRVLGVNGIGTYSYTLSICTYFILFGSVGVASYGQREIAMNRNSKADYSKLFWELFLLRLFTSLISIAIYTIFVINVGQYNIIFLILSLNIIASVLDISWFYQGLEEYKFISIRNMIIKLIFVISIFLFVKKGTHLYLYVLLNGLSLLLSSLSLWVRLPKLICKVKIKELSVFRHLKHTFIYFLPQIATQIYTMLDKTMLGIITGAQTENGYYEQAYKLITISLTIITSLNTVMSPRMSYLYKEGKIDEIKTRLLKSMRFSLFLAIPMVIGLATTANGFVGWFFGEEYNKVGILLILFAPIILIIALSNCLGGQCLTPCGKRLKSAGALFCGAFLNFIANLILIPKLGSIGAVIASILAELIITILYFILSRKYLNFNNLLKTSYKYFISSLVMGGVIFILYCVLPFGIISTFAEILIGIIIYFALLILLKDELVFEFINLIKSKLFRRA